MNPFFWNINEKPRWIRSDCLFLSDISIMIVSIGFFEKNRYPDIEYELNLPANDLTLNCDRQQIGQVLTNLLKNAAESICSRPSSNTTQTIIGRICLDMKIDTTSVMGDVLVVWAIALPSSFKLSKNLLILNP